MSVALVIERPDHDIELLPLGSLRAHRDGWAPIATGLGLELVPQFYSFLPVLPEDLDQLLEELRILRRELVRLGPEYERWVEYADKLTAALRGLKESDDEWSASIG